MKLLARTIIVLIAALGVSMPCFAQNNGNAGQGIKKIGNKFKNAATETFNDAVSAVKGEGQKGSSATVSVLYYVNSTLGSNRNDGTSQNSPFKNIQKAVETAPEGSEILVAEGNYFGTLNSGNIIIDKGLTIKGGYSADFTERNILKYRTTVCPTTSSDSTQTGNGTMQIKARKQGSKVVVDGLFFDRAGSELETSEIFLDNAFCDIEIRNCAFVNAPFYAIKGSMSGSAVITNNVFASVSAAAVEISGSNLVKNAEVKFSYNTVMFVHPGPSDRSDLACCYRFMNSVNSYLDHNVFGCAAITALDRIKTDIVKERESQKVTTSEHNVFFANAQADITLPGGSSPLKIRVADFDDVEQLAKVEGNKASLDPSIFGGRLNEEYFKGFQTSPAIKTQYSLDDALDLFGAMDGYGAQSAKNK